MATLVLTVIGDDRAGLVSALSGVIAEHDGSWERSQMSRLAGKFAGIVVVTVPDDRATGLGRALAQLDDQGLGVTVERGSDEPPAGPTLHRLQLELVGADRPGIVHDISRVLAARQVSIEELQTATREAPMAGGMLFEATAALLAPQDVPLDELQGVLEELANELMVDLRLSQE
ncbi:MAG TPA: ACT domain-containing protein [Candidatus Nanopelagicales bacterium]